MRLVLHIMQAYVCCHINWSKEYLAYISKILQKSPTIHDPEENEEKYVLEDGSLGECCKDEDTADREE